MEKMWNYIKITFIWLSSFAILLSFIGNIFCAGILWSNKEQFKFYQDYLMYRDSIELVKRDIKSDKIGIR